MEPRRAALLLIYIGLALVAIVIACTLNVRPVVAITIQICHRVGIGYRLIAIRSDTRHAHGGDASPGQPVPDLLGYSFGPNCTPTLSPPAEPPLGCHVAAAAMGGGAGDAPGDAAALDAAAPDSVAADELANGLDYVGPIDTPNNAFAVESPRNGTCSGPSHPITIIAAGTLPAAIVKCAFVLSEPTDSVAVADAAVWSLDGYWVCVRV